MTISPRTTNPEYYFVERIIDQHRNVVCESAFPTASINLRLVGPELVIAMTQAYEVTADVVRTAYAEHAPFDVLLKTNPYGRISVQGREVSEKLGIRIVDEEEIHEVLAP